MAKGRRGKSIIHFQIIMANQINSQLKSDPKTKAFISLILGIVSGVPTIYALMINLFDIKISMAESALMGFILPRGALLAVVGLIFGVLGLKSSKKNFAIAGIILCSIGLLVPLYYFFK